MSRYQDPRGATEYDDGAADYHAVAGGYRGTGSEYQPGEEDGGRSQRRQKSGGRTRGSGEGRPGGRGNSSGKSGGGRSGGGRRGPSAFGRRPVLGIIAIFATVVLTGMALTAYGAYRNVYDSINHVNVLNDMLGKRPPKLNGSLNVLMIGSDSRAGSHGTYGTGVDGSRSDTTMLLHISPQHDHVYVISFPRDSMVPVFKCDREDKNHPGQQAAPGTVERLNTSFSNGGAPCLWYTLEQTTKVHIDHFMEVDFSGFKKIVNDLGGVNVCLPFAINDPASRLHLAKGQHVIGGNQALAFVRERHIGLGSDLQRIQRQQLFLASVAQKISTSGVLGDPTKMYTLVHDVASSLTTDTGLSLTDMYAIANSLKDLSTKALRFISVPVVPYPGDPSAEVQWASPTSDQLFQSIARDTGISKAAQNAAKAGHPSPGPTVSPSHVQLQVLNGTSTEGLALNTATKLKANGFGVTGTGNATSDTYTTTVIEYSSAAQLPQVNTIKNAIAGAEAKMTSGLPAGSIELVLGSTFKGVTGAAQPKTGTAPKVAKIGNNYGGISGSTNICRDSSAFNGPDTPQMFTP
jgi:LCP family protein required for cell wall assembly